MTTSTTTLPKISPVGTPKATPMSTPVPKMPRAVSMYGAYPPRELSSSMSLIRIPQRINPLAPPPPKRRINDSWETTEQHHHNDKRRILMQTREHQRYHSAWSKPFYGSPAEKEQYRKHFREVLKQQMEDRVVSNKLHVVEKSLESKQSIAYDNDCKRKDFESYVKKHRYLENFRDMNKDLMEKKWAENQNTKFLDDRLDRERLRYNPINWSGTLK